LDKYILDSNIIIDYLRGSRKIVDLIDYLVDTNAILGCCPINITEVYAGMKEKERLSTEELFENLRIFSIDIDIAKMAGNIIRNYRSQGITLDLPDATIAAVAIHNNLVLITHNKKHYPIDELISISPDEFI
jgi:tRNA(fMet)-specific endonuclease VapC